jgi:motility quorum-sensing regulator/GCU-specific mRNA interferase toxin
MVVARGVEKRRPTYDLAAVQAVLGDVGTLAMTTSALRDAVGLGFDRAAVAAVIGAMERRMFVKSMTTYADHRVWQDVYNVPVADLVLYVKFQADVVTEFRVISFKER